MKTSSYKPSNRKELNKQLLSNDYVEKIKNGQTTVRQDKQNVLQKLSLAYDKVKETHGKVRSVCESELSSQDHTKTLLENCDALLKMTASAIKTIQSNPKYQMIKV